MGKRAADILFWSLAALSASMLVALLLLVGGVVSVDSPSDRSARTTEAEPTPERVTETRETVTETTETPKAETTAAATTTAAPASSPTLVVVTATRGDSWFSARVGSESGRVLDERVLPQGESVRLQGARIWLTVGAAGNVDVTVNGKPRDIAPGTVELVLTKPASARS